MQAFGAARLHLLDELKRRPGSAVLASDSGYGIARRGRHSTQIGPVVAMTPTVANGLAAQLVEVTAGAIVADVPRSAENLAYAGSAGGLSRLRGGFTEWLSAGPTVLAMDPLFTLLPDRSLADLYGNNCGLVI